MKSWVAKSKVGFFNAYWVGGMPTRLVVATSSHVGGQAVEQTIHTFDMCRNLFGEVVAVQASDAAASSPTLRTTTLKTLGGQPALCQWHHRHRLQRSASSAAAAAKRH